MSSRDTGRASPQCGGACGGPASTADCAPGTLSRTLGRVLRHHGSQHPPAKWHNLSSHTCISHTFTYICRSTCQTLKILQHRRQALPFFVGKLSSFWQIHPSKWYLFIPFKQEAAEGMGFHLYPSEPLRVLLGYAYPCCLFCYYCENSKDKRKAWSQCGSSDAAVGFVFGCAQ